MPSTIDLDHVAIAVERWEQAWPRYGGDLGGEWLSSGEGPGFAPAQLRFGNTMKLEVLRPNRVEENDFLRRFLDRNGPGVHHLTFKVDDLGQALSRAQDGGYRPIGVDRSSPHWQEAFLHPRDIPGVVVQLAQAAGPMHATSRPESWPAKRPARPARLEYVGHAVIDRDEGLRLYGGLLDGVPTAEGEAAGVRWIELAWPGPGRVRLLDAPDPDAAPAAKELRTFLGDRRGAIHHVAFAVDRPAEVPGAISGANGHWVVPADANLGVTLVLS